MSENIIPLRNIWLLFLYATNLVEFKQRFDGEAERAADLPELIAVLLSRVVTDRFRRNLSRGYRPRTETLSRVRGRIDTLTTEIRQQMDRGLITCRFEGHTNDTPRNRLVRAALERLAARVANPDIAAACRAQAAQFHRLGVSGTRPSRAEMAQDQIGRNEQNDKLMLALAHMVFELMIPTETLGRRSLPEPELRKRLLPKLFEKAMGNALAWTLRPKGWSVRQGRRLQWPIEDATPGIAAILPGMKTDIELSHPALGRHVVIDTKFTKVFTRSNYREYLLKSGYLYQIYAYIRTQENVALPISLSSEGMLLHPQIGDSVDETMLVQGHALRIKTIDLSQDPDGFERALTHII